MSGTSSSYSFRKNLTSFGNVLLQLFYILVIYRFSFISAELAYFFSSHATAASSFIHHEISAPFYFLFSIFYFLYSIILCKLLQSFNSQENYCSSILLYKLLVFKTECRHPLLPGNLQVFRTQSLEKSFHSCHPILKIQLCRPQHQSYKLLRLLYSCSFLSVIYPELRQACLLSNIFHNFLRFCQIQLSLENQSAFLFLLFAVCQ